ncbi:MAG: hypothetical protein LBT14_10070 [Treponema sp.]|jgi:hypothetical protein|nr:hypothetical protein [Treponema sp.]
MKKSVILAFLVLLCLATLEAKERTLRVGLGLEANMNTGEGYALGRSFSLDFQFLKYIVNGVTLTISDDFKIFTVIEPAIFGRWYFLNLGLKEGGFFVQGDLGASLVVEASETTPHILGGLTTGFRYPFLGGDYYVEPFVKGGYPFLWGAGARFGCRF